MTGISREDRLAEVRDLQGFAELLGELTDGANIGWRKSGSGRTTFHYLLQGRHLPSQKTLERLLEACGVEGAAKKPWVDARERLDLRKKPVPVREPKPSPRPVWTSLPAPANVHWRTGFDRSYVAGLRDGPPALELHLVPVERQRVSIIELRELAPRLVEWSLLTPDRPPLVRCEAGFCLVAAPVPGEVPGLAVTGHGQRSGWLTLARRDVRYTLDEPAVAEQIHTLLELLMSLPLRSPKLVAPAVGVEPAKAVAMTREDGEPARLVSHMPYELHPAAGNALPWDTLTKSPVEVCAELAARVVEEGRQVAGHYEAKYS